MFVSQYHIIYKDISNQNYSLFELELEQLHISIARKLYYIAYWMLFFKKDYITNSEVRSSNPWDETS